MPDEHRKGIPEGAAEKRADPNTVMTAVNTAATLISTGLAAHQAHQSGKEKDPPKKDT